MKPNIQTVLAICLISLSSIRLEAQTPTPTSFSAAGQNDRKPLSPEERAKKDAERAEKKLALTKDQKSSWETAALERAKSNQPLREKMKGSTTPEERKNLHAQMKANKDKFNTAVSALLSPEQKTKYEQMKKDREKKGNHRKGKRNDHPALQNNSPE